MSYLSQQLLADDSKNISSPSGPLLSTTPSWGKLLIVSKSAATPVSRRTGTNHNQTILTASARVPTEDPTSHHSVLKDIITSTSYGAGMSSPTATKKRPTPRFSTNSNPTGNKKPHSNHYWGKLHHLPRQHWYKNWLPQDIQIGCQQRNLLSRSSII